MSAQDLIRDDTKYTSCRDLCRRYSAIVWSGNTSHHHFETATLRQKKLHYDALNEPQACLVAALQCSSAVSW